MSTDNKKLESIILLMNELDGETIQYILEQIGMDEQIHNQLKVKNMINRIDNIEEITNELIAEFMGGIKSSVPNLINLPQTIGQSSILCVKGSEGLPSSTYKVERINELQYHSSWDWLMPVVREILMTIELDGLDFATEELRYNTLDCDISGAYKEVVELINQYNKTI